MALQGAIAGPKPGKKIVHGTVACTDTAVIDLSSELATVDNFAITRQTAAAATNAFHNAAISAKTILLACKESDFTAGTTAATFYYIAIGDQPR